MAGATRRFTPQRQASILNSFTVFFFIIALGLTIPSLVLVSFLTKNQLSIEVLPDAHPTNEAVSNRAPPSVPEIDTTDNRSAYKLRQVEPTENEQKSVSKPQNSAKIKKREFKTGFPGFTKEPIVLCGGHSAPSCDKCPQGNGASWCNGECEWDFSNGGQCVRNSKVAHLHPDYFRIIERYAFQPVVNQRNEYVNIIMVRAPFRGKDDEDLFNFYRDDILFLGISSFEAFPLKSPNPYSAVYESEYYLNMFPGFLHMMREPEEHFPSHVQTILMSQSDFMLDDAINFGNKHANEEKIYDFVYSGGDQDVGTDCVGWASYNKNFSFVREALEVMCSPEFNVTGVLVANKNKQGTKACTIPASCEGKIVQTSFLDQKAFFGYLSKARFAFLPQICDASPRVSTQALSMNIPLLMNRNIMGGWKYLLPGKTGEFFHDMSDFNESLRRILNNTRGNSSPYEPLDFVLRSYGNRHSGKKLFDFVKRNWEDKIDFPDDTELLLPTGA